MANRLVCHLSLVFLLVLAGCGGGSSVGGGEPDIVVVQHILIGFQGSVPGKDVARSMEEAEALASELLERAKAGEDFDVLVEEYTDDNFPGVYEMANNGVEADKTRNVFSRRSMARSFGDVSFSLPIGGIGMATYHKEDCKYGWHIIKRLE